MNKGITLLVLVAILGAMGLVLYSHSGKPKQPEQPAPVAGTVQTPQSRFEANGAASPLQNLQGESRGLSPIEPPINSGTATRLPEGAPVPITLNPDGKAAHPAPARTPEPPAVKAEAEKPTPPKTSPKEPTTPAAPPKAKEEAPKSPPKQETAQAQPKKEEKSPSTAPGLEPWTVPPPAQTAPVSTPPASQPAQSQASAPPTVSAPLVAEQRLATDPIRPVQPSDKGTHKLAGISLAQSGQGLRLRIEADSAFPCKTFVLTGPDRLVIDLPGSWQGMKAPSVPQNNLVKNARLGQQTAGPRLVLDLTGPIRQHRTERSGTVVDVLLN